MSGDGKRSWAHLAEHQSGHARITHAHFRRAACVAEVAVRTVMGNAKLSFAPELWHLTSAVPLAAACVGGHAIHPRSFQPLGTAILLGAVIAATEMLGTGGVSRPLGVPQIVCCLGARGRLDNTI